MSGDAVIHALEVAGPLARLTSRRHDEAEQRIGVGPSDKTGKSFVRCWPGGKRRAVSSTGRRLTNPRVGMSVLPGELASVILRVGTRVRARGHA